MFCPPGQARSNNIDKIRYCSQYIDGLFQVFSSQEQRTAQLCKRAKGYDLQLSATFYTRLGRKSRALQNNIAVITYCSQTQVC